MYRTFWAEGQAVGEPEVVTRSLARVLGEEKARELVDGTGRKEVKALLNGNTEKALEAGAFGVPFWVVADGEGREGVFFGVDRVGMVLDFMCLERGEDKGIRALL